MSLLALSIAACVHRDSVEQTLVTVDVSGTWRLRQQQLPRRSHPPASGPKVTGYLRIYGSPTTEEGAGEGSVQGDVFKVFVVRGRLRGELTVNGDEMARTGTALGPVAISLRRQ